VDTPLPALHLPITSVSSGDRSKLQLSESWGPSLASISLGEACLGSPRRGLALIRRVQPLPALAVNAYQVRCHRRPWAGQKWTNQRCLSAGGLRSYPCWSLVMLSSSVLPSSWSRVLFSSSHIPFLFPPTVERDLVELQTFQDERSSRKSQSGGPGEAPQGCSGRTCPFGGPRARPPIQSRSQRCRHCRGRSRQATPKSEGETYADDRHVSQVKICIKTPADLISAAVLSAQVSSSDLAVLSQLEVLPPCSSVS
jgi:hypothetical protein